MTDVAPIIICPVGATLGEGPVWIDDALWFVDIKERSVHRFEPITQALTSWPAPDQIGWILPAENGTLIAGLRDGVHRFDAATGTFSLILKPDHDRPGNRLNDATVDPAGRLWFGSMDDGETAPTGRLYRAADDGCVDSGLAPTIITNGPAVSPDGRILYHTDTLGRVIWRVPMETDGTLGKPERFATIEESAGYPDGPTIDAEGHVWTGLFGGWAVRRYAPDGRLVATVRFPTANITKIAFGGADLRTAFATTARKGLDGAALARQPDAGHLFAFDPGVAGLPMPCAKINRDRGEEVMTVKEIAPTSIDRVNIAFVASIVAVATIGGFMFGYDSGVINGTQKGLEAAFDLGRLGIGVNVGAILLGSAIGAFGAGRLADLIGRRSVMMLAAVLFLASALLAGAAGSSMIFILARVVGGLGVGAASVISPVYISEVTPAAIRGRLSSVQQVMIITGLTGAFVANFVLARFAGGSTAELWLGFAAWRWMFWLQAIPAAIYFLALLFIPESPRYLVAKSRIADAQSVLTRLFGASEADRKIGEINASLAADHHRPKLSDLIDRGTGKVRPILWAGIGLAIFQQLVGINVVFYYGATLWEAVGFSEDDALKTNIVSGALSIGACLLAIALIDRIGRKPLLLIGSAGMAMTLAIVGYAFSTALPGPHGVSLPSPFGVTALVAANLYVIFFNISWGPVMWVMLGEMFPNQIRGSALAVAGFAQWIANGLISVSFPSLAVSPGLTVTYFGYAAFALISFFFVRSMVHETKGRELEDMVG